jgi:UDP-glucose 4-epimerase
VETALDLRPKVDVFGTDYSAANGTCIRDYIQVSDLVRAHCDAPAYLRRRGVSVMLDRDYGRGFCALEAIETVKRSSGVDFKVAFAGRGAGDPT